MDRYIEIKLTKYTIILTEKELLFLLSQDINLWREAIRRGKAILRARTERAREVTKDKQVLGGGRTPIEVASQKIKSNC
ncbi:hypothetical protein MTBGP_09770 [Moorella thermoacetica]|uniref:hypothetical protein n=1 Tax=Neomoorella thermoacetica TaxID=1525 RepID=UPI0030D49283